MTTGGEILIIMALNQYLQTRIKGIRDVLMAHHRGGQNLPSDTNGAEREIVLEHFLKQVLPPIYRFGSGVIIDAAGRRTGAVDLVMEIPFAPSFPLPAATERLYIAESVAAAIEVKSDLHSQWDQVKDTMSKVNAVRRDVRDPEEYFEKTRPATEPILKINPQVIPAYVVAYTGHNTIDGLRKRLESTNHAVRPHGVLVIESGCFDGLTGQHEGIEGLFAFVAELVALLNRIVGVCYPNVAAYFQTDGPGHVAPGFQP